MNFDDFKTYLASQSIEVASKIRQMEEEAKNYSLDIHDDRLYIALKAHRHALNEILKELKK